MNNETLLRMRDELAERCFREFSDQRLKSLDDCCKQLTSGLRDGADIDTDALRTERIEQLHEAQKKITEIYNTSPEEIERLYLTTFNRWRPI